MVKAAGIILAAFIDARRQNKKKLGKGSKRSVQLSENGLWHGDRAGVRSCLDARSALFPAIAE